MIPSNTPASVSYTGNNTAKVFNYPFRILTTSNIKVYVVKNDTKVITNLTLSTHYTLTIKAFPLLGGTVTLVNGAFEWITATNLETGYTLHIEYVVISGQASTFRDLGPQAPVAIEKQLDKISMDLIGIKELTESYPEVPNPSPDKILGWDATGTFLENKDASALVPSLPNGGAIGAALVKNSATDGDAEWDDLVISGYSARFGVAWSSTGLRDFIEKILDITYLGPLIASFSGSSNTLREKGDAVASIVLSTNVTKRSNNIARIRFLQGVTVIADENPPVVIGSGITTATYSTPFSDNITFTTEVTDATGGGGPTMVTANTSYSFVYPYYYGADVPGLTPAQVAALTKSIINSSANVNRVFNTANGDVYYFAYPASYGNLTSILDENGFETFSSWTKTVANITGLDATAVSYNIYESNNPVVAGTTNFTFKR